MSFHYCLECGNKLLSVEGDEGFCYICKTKNSGYAPYSFGDEHSIIFDVETSEFESRSL
jgi:hypothetical protein